MERQLDLIVFKLWAYAIRHYNIAKKMPAVFTTNGHKIPSSQGIIISRQVEGTEVWFHLCGFGMEFSISLPKIKSGLSG